MAHVSVFTLSAPIHDLPTSTVFLSVFLSLPSVCLPTQDKPEYTYISAPHLCPGDPACATCSEWVGMFTPVLTVLAKAAG